MGERKKTSGEPYKRRTRIGAAEYMKCIGVTGEEWRAGSIHERKKEKVTVEWKSE